MSCCEWGASTKEAPRECQSQKLTMEELPAVAPTKYELGEEEADETTGDTKEE